MKIEINDHRKLFAIQEEFGNLFSNLKIEFYSRPSHSGAPHPKKLIDNYSKTLGECRELHTKGTLTISPSMTLSEITSNFEDVYGIAVDILKKEGEHWINATSHDITLEELNKN